MCPFAITDADRYVFGSNGLMPKSISMDAMGSSAACRLRAERLRAAASTVMAVDVDDDDDSRDAPLWLGGCFASQLTQAGFGMGANWIVGIIDFLSTG